jgi:multidrug transporter EmrE-like cation transporter
MLLYSRCTCGPGNTTFPAGKRLRVKYAVKKSCLLPNVLRYKLGCADDSANHFIISNDMKTSTMPPPLLVTIAIFATAFAQVLLKKASYFDIKTSPWLVYMGISAVFYGFSFILYSRVLKYYPINKIYPAMTVGQIILITLFGLYIGEIIDGRHALGMLLGAVSIYLIMS